jgi:hypothetical protein
MTLLIALTVINKSSLSKRFLVGFEILSSESPQKVYFGVLFVRNFSSHQRATLKVYFSVLLMDNLQQSLYLAGLSGTV